MRGMKWEEKEEIGTEGGEKEKASRARARACGSCLRWPLTEQRSTQRTRGNVAGSIAYLHVGVARMLASRDNRCSIEGSDVYTSMIVM